MTEVIRMDNGTAIVESLQEEIKQLKKKNRELREKLKQAKNLRDFYKRSLDAAEEDIEDLRRRINDWVRW